MWRPLPCLVSCFSSCPLSGLPSLIPFVSLQAKSSGKTPQVKGASASAKESPRKAAPALPPGKAGPVAAQVGKGKGEDAESSTEESDSEEEAPAAVPPAKSPAQVRRQVPRSESPSVGLSPAPCLGPCALHLPSSPPVSPHTQSPVGPCPDLVFCYSQAKPLGQNSQFRAASGPVKGPPQKVGPSATPVGKQEEDSESSSEEESDSEAEAPAQVRRLPIRLFSPTQGQEPSSPDHIHTH